MSDLTSPLILDRLFLIHRRTLVLTLTRMIGCSFTAEDLVHEAYVRVSAAITTRPVDHLQPFLYQTARNLAIDHLRREQLRRRFITEDADSESALSVPSSEPSPETRAAGRQRLALFDQALSALPDRARQVLLLNRVHGLSYPQIAARLGVSESTVCNDIRLALAHCLARMINKDLL